MRGLAGQGDPHLWVEVVSGQLGDHVADGDLHLAVREQSPVRNPSSGFRLYRIGDAVSGRGIHAAVLDAYRLCVAI